MPWAEILKILHYVFLGNFFWYIDNFLFLNYRKAPSENRAQPVHRICKSTPIGTKKEKFTKAKHDQPK